MSGVSCDECGGSGATGSCAELFGQLLALDHERRSPWAEHHAVNVACYLLQHPSQTKPAVLTGQWQTLQTFVNVDLAAVHTLTARRVAQNSHRGRGPDDDGAPSPSPNRLPAYTIADVGVDGTFPSRGAAERIAVWVAATVASRRTTTPSPHPSEDSSPCVIENAPPQSRSP